MTAASFLLYLLGCLQIVAVVAAVVGLYDAFKAGATDGGADPESGAGMALVISAVAVLMVLALASFEFVLAALIGKGKNAARIVTWVYLGLIACCCGPSILMHRRVTEGAGPRTTDAGQIAPERQPEWVEQLDLASRGVHTILAILIAILLATSTANAYFRRPPAPPSWQPPGSPAWPPRY